MSLTSPSGPRPGDQAPPNGATFTTGPPPDRIAHLRLLARLMDTEWQLPGTSFRVGLDALIGLIPGIGDMVGTVVSGFILLESARLGAPASLLSRMFFNVMVDSVTGVVPVAGDIVDAFWKSNAKNVALLDRHFADPRAAGRSNRRFVALVLLVALTFVAAFAFLMATLFIFLVKLLRHD